jgi:hypothetical protein
VERLVQRTKELPYFAREAMGAETFVDFDNAAFGAED